LGEAASVNSENRKVTACDKSTRRAKSADLPAGFPRTVAEKSVDARHKAGQDEIERF
jgi:hypothetical protein